MVNRRYKSYIQYSGDDFSQQQYQKAFSKQRQAYRMLCQEEEKAMIVQQHVQSLQLPL